MDKSESGKWQAKWMRADDFSRYLTAHSLQLTCPVCSTSNWLLQDQEDVATPAFTGATWGDDTRLPVIVLVCAKCSYINLFARRGVQAWVDSNPAPPEGDPA